MSATADTDISLFARTSRSLSHCPPCTTWRLGDTQGTHPLPFFLLTHDSYLDSFWGGHQTVTVFDSAPHVTVPSHLLSGHVQLLLSPHHLASNYWPVPCQTCVCIASIAVRIIIGLSRQLPTQTSPYLLGQAEACPIARPAPQGGWEISRAPSPTTAPPPPPPIQVTVGIDQGERSH